MSKETLARPLGPIAKLTGSALSLSLIFLLIEFFDELHYGVQGAVLPAIRADLGLSYAQIGLLLGIPALTGALIEPALMLLGDTGLRKRLVAGGGLAVAAVVLLIATSASFPAILFAFILGYPASGAFVTLAQATLMDLNPGREAQSMARWTVFGSVANLAGPLLAAGGFALAWGWRWIYFGLAALALGLALSLLPRRFPTHPSRQDEPAAEPAVTLRQLGRNLWEALTNPRLLRWVVLMEFADLLLDVFSGYTALYFTDVVGVTEAQASLLLTVLMVAGLLAGLLLIPMLERIPGMKVLRVSAGIALVIYAAWLAAPWLWAKVVLLAALPFATASWYPVLQGEAYASAPGRSGTVMAVTSLAGLLGGALVWLVGWVAEAAGLPAAMALLLLGPVSLVLFVKE